MKLFYMMILIMNMWYCVTDTMCQNPWNFAAQRMKLNVYKFKKKTHLGGQGTPK